MSKMIKLSKSDWQKIGLKMGWIRTAQEGEETSETKKLFELIQRKSKKRDTKEVLEICAQVDCSNAQEMMGHLQKGNEDAIESAYQMQVNMFDAYNYTDQHGGPSDVEYYHDATLEYVRSAGAFEKCAEALSKRCPNVQMPPMQNSSHIDTRKAESEGNKRFHESNRR